MAFAARQWTSHFKRASADLKNQSVMRDAPGLSPWKMEYHGAAASWLHPT